MVNLYTGGLRFLTFYVTVLRCLTLPYIDFLRGSKVPLASLCLILSMFIPANSLGKIINQTSPVSPQGSIQCKCALVRNLERSMRSASQDVHLFCFITGTLAETSPVVSVPMFKDVFYWELNEVLYSASRLCSLLGLQEANSNDHLTLKPLLWR